MTAKTKNEWPLVPLKDITTKIGSGATPRGGKNAYKSQGLSLIRSLNVYDFKFAYKGLAYIDESQADGLKNVIVEPDDVLLNITGASVARCCIVPKRILPARVNQHVAIIRVDSRIANPFYVLNIINSSRYKSQLLAISQGGATREALTKEKVEKFEIPLAPLETQHKIATILSAYDNLIENNTRRIKILEEMAQTIYREWFVNFRFPGREKVKMVDSSFGMIPEGWEEKTLSGFGEVITGKTPSKKVPANFDGEMPFIKTPDMHGNFFCIETTETLSALGVGTQKNKTIPANSLCVSCIGTPGIITITTEPAQTNQQINSIILHDISTREFLYFALEGLKETMSQHGSSGATMFNLNKGKFEALPVVYPANKYLASYHKATAPMFNQIKVLQIKNSNLRQTCDLLLPKLISGAIDVSELKIETQETAA